MTTLDEIDALKAALAAERAARQQAEARASGAEAMVAHLKLLIAKMKRDRFGQSSERGQRLLDQMELQLEELEASAAEDETATAPVDTTARSASDHPGPTARSGHRHARRQMSEPDLIPDGSIFGDEASAPARSLTEAELAEFEARDRERQALRDEIHPQLRNDAQACARIMYFSPQLNSPEQWEATVSKALEDYQSGHALMDQLGADRLLDAPDGGNVTSDPSQADRGNKRDLGQRVGADRHGGDGLRERDAASSCDRQHGSDH